MQEIRGISQEDIKRKIQKAEKIEELCEEYSAENPNLWDYCVLLAAKKLIEIHHALTDNPDDETFVSLTRNTKSLKEIKQLLETRSEFEKIFVDEDYLRQYAIAYYEKNTKKNPTDTNLVGIIYEPEN